MKRMHIEPLPPAGPRMLNSVLAVVRRALTQPKVQRIEISLKGIEVEREMEDPDEPVIPPGGDVDGGYLIERIKMLAHPYKPEEHAVYALYGATALVEQADREVFAVMVPGWPLFAAWLGVDVGKVAPRTAFGLKMMYVPTSVTNDRIILLGAPPTSLFLSDVDLGVAIDIGV